MLKSSCELWLSIYRFEVVWILLWCLLSLVGIMRQTIFYFNDQADFISVVCDIYDGKWMNFSVTITSSIFGIMDGEAL